MLHGGDTYPVMSSKPIISGSQSSSTEELPEGVAMGVGSRSSALVSATAAADAAAGGTGAAAEAPEESPIEPGGDAAIASAGSTLNGFGSSLPFGVATPDPAPVGGIGVALLRGNVFNGFTAGRLGNLRAATEVSTKSSIKPSSAIMLTPRFFVIDRRCISDYVYVFRILEGEMARKNERFGSLVFN